MKTDRQFHPDFLRPAKLVLEPDPRSRSSVTLDRTTGAFRPLEVQEYQQAVARFLLVEHVPEDVFIHFETAKNLYVYAYFVYRFYPVAEHQALTCLEFALGKRYAVEMKKRYKRRPTLGPLLRHAVECGDVRNEGFRKWHEAAEKRARNRYEMEVIDEMSKKGLETMVVDYSNVKIEDVDRNWDYIKLLVEYLPDLRNHYAHGTGMLHNRVLGTIEVVSEIVNQAYSKRSDL